MSVAKCGDCRFFVKGAVTTEDIQVTPGTRPVSRKRLGVSTCSVTGKPANPYDAACSRAE